MTKQNTHRFLYLTLFLIIGITTYSQVKHLKTNKVSSVTAKYLADFFAILGREVNDIISSLASFLIWQHDTSIYEGYFHGATNQTSFNIKSATKTVVSAIAGIAKDRSLLPDLNTPVLAILSEYSKPL